MKANTEIPTYGSTGTIRPQDNRHPPSPADRYPTAEISRSGFQPYRPEER